MNALKGKAAPDIVFGSDIDKVTGLADLAVSGDLDHRRQYHRFALTLLDEHEGLEGDWMGFHWKSHERRLAHRVVLWGIEQRAKNYGTLEWLEITREAGETVVIALIPRVSDPSVIDVDCRASSQEFLELVYVMARTSGLTE